MVSLENLTIKERYLLIKKIGEGSFGEVYLAIDNVKGNYLAVKCESATA
jgi:serine/threonine protein kinase